MSENVTISKEKYDYFVHQIELYGECKKDAIALHKRVKKSDAENQLYRAALELLNEDVKNSPYERAEDGSPIENTFERFVYEITEYVLEESK